MGIRHVQGPIAVVSLVLMFIGCAQQAPSGEAAGAASPSTGGATATGTDGGADRAAASSTSAGVSSGVGGGPDQTRDEAESDQSSPEDAGADEEASGSASMTGAALYFADLASAPACDGDHLHQLIYVLSERQFEVCGTDGWQPVDISGPAGETGSAGAAGQAGETGAQGPQGPQGAPGASGASAASSPVAVVRHGFEYYSTNNVFPKGMMVTFDGTQSLSPAGAGLTCTWRVVARPVGSSLTTASAKDCSFPAQLMKVGGYQIGLTVSDGSRSSSEAVMTVNVIEAAKVRSRAMLVGTVTSPTVGSSVQIYLISYTLDPSVPAGGIGSESASISCDLSLASSSAGVPPPSFGSKGLYASTYWSQNVTFNAGGAHALKATCTDGASFTAASPLEKLFTITVPGGSSEPSSVPPSIVQGVQRRGSRGVKHLMSCGALYASSEALTYAWSLASKPAGSSAALISAGAGASLVPDVAGTYVASCAISNSAGTASTDNTLIVDPYWPGVIVADPGLASVQTPVPNMPSGPDVVARVDVAGTLHVAYFAVDTQRPRYAAKTGGSILFEEIETSGVNGLFPSLAINTSNQPVVAYYSPAIQKIKVATRTGVNTWSIDTLARAIALPTGSAIAIDGSGSINVFYYDQATKALYLAAKAPSGAWAETRLDSSSADVGENPSAIYASATNTLWVTYYDGANKALRYGVRVGAGAWAHGNVATSGAPGYYSSLALKSDGTPAVAFAFQNASTLGYAVWGGSSWTVTSYIYGGGTQSSLVRPALAIRTSTNLPTIIFNPIGSTSSCLQEASYNGTSWSGAGTPVGDICGGYTQVAAASDGSGNISMLGFKSTAQHFTLNVKTAGTWGTASPFANGVGSAGGVGDGVAPARYASLFSTPNGTLHVTATNDQSGAYSGITHSYRTAGGNWSTERAKTLPSTGLASRGEPLSTSSVRVMSFNQSTLSWADGSVGSWPSFSTWSQSLYPTTFSAATDSANNTHVCYHNGFTAYFYASYTLSTTTWAPPVGLASVPSTQASCEVAVVGSTVYAVFSDPLRQAVYVALGASGTFDVKPVVGRAATAIALVASGTTVHLGYLSEEADGSHTYRWRRVDDLTQPEEVALSGCQNLDISLAVNQTSGQPVASCVKSASTRSVAIATRTGSGAWSAQTATSALPASGTGMHRLLWYNGGLSLVFTNDGGHLTELRGN